jgi:predicted ArsR family transcriptional regulator
VTPETRAAILSALSKPRSVIAVSTLAGLAPSGVARALGHLVDEGAVTVTRTYSGSRPLGIYRRAQVQQHAAARS